MTAGPSTTVVTVTAPNTVFENGALVRQRVLHTLTAPARTVRLPSHVVRALGAHRLAVTNPVVHVTKTKVIVILIHVYGCPPGTALYHGTCSPIVHGKG